MKKKNKCTDYKFKSRHPDKIKVCDSDLYLLNSVPVPKKLPNSSLQKVPGLKKAKLFDAGGDMAKKWYLDVELIDSQTGEAIRQRLSKKINNFNSEAERRSFAAQYFEGLRKLLLDGYRFTRQTRFDELPNFNPTYTPEKTTLQQAFEIFIQSKANVSKPTLNRYNATLRYLKDYEKAHRPILFLKCAPPHIEAILHHIEETRNIEPKTYNHYRSIFSAVFFHFRKLGWINRNPVDMVVQKRVKKGKLHFPLTLDQIRTIKELALDHHDYQFVLFLSFSFYTLARPGKELRFLKISDIEGQSVWINPDNAKSGEARRVELVKPLREVIQETKILSFPPSHYIFSSRGLPGTQPVGKCYFYRKQVYYLKLAGLDGKGHDLYCYKHSGAIQMIKSGFTAFEVMQMAGHKNVQQTMDYLYNIGAISRLGDKGNDMPAI